MLETLVRVPCEAGVPVLKISDHSVNHGALFHTFYGLSLRYVMQLYSYVASIPSGTHLQIVYIAH